MVGKSLQVLALLAALESTGNVQQVQHDPWAFLKQFDITPESLVDDRSQSLLPAFNELADEGVDSFLTISNGIEGLG